MKVSFYNVFLDQFALKKRGLVYNTNSGAVVSITSSKTWEGLKENRPECICDEDIGALVDNGILVDSFESEFSAIKTRYENRVNNPTVLNLTILPTEACNFACPYCFLWEKTPRVMKEKVYNSILTFVEKRIKMNSQLHAITVNWFGGEPTLCANQILQFMPKIKKLSEEHGLSLKSSITTNGYLLDQKMLIALYSAGVTQYQVTIDGNKQTHNLGRPHKTDPDSYSRIMSNLRMIASLPEEYAFSMDIRCNFTKKTVDATNDLIDDFGRIFAHDLRFKMYCRPVYYYNTKENLIEGIASDLFGLAEGLEKQNEFARRIHDIRPMNTNRRIIDPIPQPTLCWCNAESREHYIVGAEGELYACDTMTGKENIIGEIVEGEIRYDKDIRYNIFADDRTQKCMTCRLLPICMGGCLRNRIQSDAECYWSYNGLVKALQNVYG